MKKISRIRVIAFCGLLIVFTGLSFFLASYIRNENLRFMAIMWSPALAAILTGLWTKRPFLSFGWKFSLKWAALGWIIPILYAGLAYGAVWILGLGGVPNPTFIERARFTLGMESLSDKLVILFAFFYITIFNLVPATILSLGEELGWRGFLVPEMADWVGLKRASLISGIIWAIWHLPEFITGKYGVTGTPLLYQLVCFVMLVVTTGIILAWLRMRSGSIWPAAIFHATHNGVIQMFFNRITVDNGNTLYFIGEFGIALMPFTLVLAWYLYRRLADL